jgi:hypothetical protein
MYTTFIHAYLFTFFILDQKITNAFGHSKKESKRCTLSREEADGQGMEE